MRRSVKIRIALFVALSAVGITYVAAGYLGLVDKALGRGITVTATLPTSGGLFEGSAVTYRGVKVGEVSQMDVSREGVELTLELEDGTRLPKDSPMYVHNLSAIGEQYLDFQPEDDQGPYAENGDSFTGDEDALPVDEGDLLVDLDAFVNSVDQDSLNVLIRELGDMFADTGRPLQRLIDSGGRFIDEATAATDETIQLLRSGLVTLRTQQGQKENIRTLSRQLALLTDTLRGSDADLRTTLDKTPPLAREVTALLRDLGPTMPTLLGNLIAVQEVVLTHLDGVEQLLVTFPAVIASGFTGTPPDGFGHVNMQLDYSQPPCTEGYKPPNTWRRPDQLDDGPIVKVRCKSGPPYVMRGVPHVPSNQRNSSPPRTYAGTYDPATGLVPGAVDGNGRPVRVQPPGDLSILGDDSWKWLLVGPTAGR